MPRSRTRRLFQRLQQGDAALDLCDLFHPPILNRVSNSGFAVGLEHEISGIIGQGYWFT